jgi:cytochrome c556
MRGMILAGAVLAVGFIGAAYAQGTIPMSADAIIAARQAGYDNMSASVADMKRAVDAKVTEVKPFKNNADAIVHWAKAVPSLFPPGTEKGHDTKALPTVWSDRAGFEKAAMNLQVAGEALSKAAEANDPAAFAVAFQNTGKACGGCHHDFRAK